MTRFSGLLRSAMILFALLPAFRPTLACAGGVAGPTAEFATPYQVQPMPDGETVEISGSFSWALALPDPQRAAAVSAVLGDD